jgi:hypothetical protein
MVIKQPRPQVAAPSHLSTVLVVGNLESWQKSGRLVPNLPGFHFAAFKDVTSRLLHEVAPDLVLSALMGDDYDVIELARRLAMLDYLGRYRALTAHLPNPALVLNEVRAAAPQIDFDLFNLERDFQSRM